MTKLTKISINTILKSHIFSLLKTMQRTRRSHASDACSIHSTELDLRDVECNGGGLQPGLHHFQRTGQNSSHCTATSRAKFNRSGMKEGKNKVEERAWVAGNVNMATVSFSIYLGENREEADENKRNIHVNKWWVVSKTIPGNMSCRWLASKII